MMIGVMVQTAFLVMAILAVRKIFGEKLHAYVRYGLWLLVVFRLVLPVNLVDSPFSMLRVVKTGTKYEEEADSNMVVPSGQEVDLAGNHGRTAEPSLEETLFTDVTDGLSSEGEWIWRNGEKQIGSGAQAGDVEHPKQNLQFDGRAQTGSDVQTDGISQTETGSIGQTGGMSQTGNMRQIGNEQRTSDTEQAGVMGRISDVLPIKMIAQVIWIAGSLVVGIFLEISNFHFNRRLHASRVFYKESCTVVLHKKQLPIYRVKDLESPCLVGFWHPAVYIGMDVDTDSDTFHYAMAHEEVHYLHKDHIWAFVRVALVAIYWFHPFVWIAAAASAKDGELACDYGTIRQLGEKERYAYSEMLVAFSCAKREKEYSYGTMLRPNQSELKERILRLTRGNGNRMWAGILAVVLMAALAGCAFTGAAEDADIILTNPAGVESENVDMPENLEASESGIYENANQERERDVEENNAVTEPRQIESVPADISEQTPFGSDGPTLDFAGNLGAGKESVVIFHDYFGLVVYDLTNWKIVGSLDLKTIGCHMTQGDDACQVAVSADGKTVWLHPRSKQYMYRYEIEEDLLYQEPLVKTFEIDLEGKELFDRYLVTEETPRLHADWRSNYLYEEYQDEQGIHTEYIFLCVPGEESQTIGSLQCEWSDMVFDMFRSEEEARESPSAESEEFPYHYDGIVNEVEIIYDKPCDYQRISDVFGSRLHPFTQEVRMHEGIDYVAEKGTDIVAAADGVVYATGYLAEYGNYVVLLHINGDMTYYCMCQDIAVEKDMQVKRGEKIATVGSSGRSTGAHLHFALSRYGEFIDPEEHMRSVVGLDEDTE
ncbi:MAG: M23/M56 family metallopeptidase [Eubacterium sp.]|nr:M23/M56 family metallopeptidase [Eubacterium sp.]